MTGTYEMLWDCPYCGTRKLLGKTHRHCPGCGAPQDPDKRYFPADDEKVAVEDHEYVGADRRCEACGAPMSAHGSHCTQCGSPLEGASEVRRVADAGADTVPARPATATRATGARSRGWIRGCLATLIGLLVLGLLALFWRREAVAEVRGHAWERRVGIEAFGPQQASAWCDEMPGDAYDVSRSREVRAQRSVPDGEDCVTERSDNGDGTFREQQRCTPRFREEPVYAERCRFTVDRWAESRTERAEGSDLNAAWPAPKLRAGECRGCEREGQREASYRVRFTGPDGTPFECAFDDESRWRRFTPGSRWKVAVGVLTGGAACGSLREAR